MKTRFILSILLCLLLLSSILSAAIQDDQPQYRRRTRENMRTLWLLRMTRALELTEEQTAKVFPIVARIDKEKSEIYQQIGKQVRELRLILREEEPDQKELKNKINKIKELRNLIKSGDRLGVSYYIYDDFNFDQLSNTSNAQLFIDLTNNITRNKELMLAHYPPKKNPTIFQRRREMMKNTFLKYLALALVLLMFIAASTCTKPVQSSPLPTSPAPSPVRGENPRFDFKSMQVIFSRNSLNNKRLHKNVA